MVGYQSTQRQRRRIGQVGYRSASRKIETAQAAGLTARHGYQPILRHRDVAVLSGIELHRKQRVMVGQHEVDLAAVQHLRGFSQRAGSDLQLPVGALQ